MCRARHTQLLALRRQKAAAREAGVVCRKYFEKKCHLIMETRMEDKDTKLARNLIIIVVAIFIIPVFFRAHILNFFQNHLFLTCGGIFISCIIKTRKKYDMKTTQQFNTAENQGGARVPN
jgi:hypothetical protein